MTLGSAGLMINVITPLQNFNQFGTKINDVLRQRYEDLFNRDLGQTAVTEVGDVYFAKKEVCCVRPVANRTQEATVNTIE
jgi:hypothetical protein